MGLQKKAANVLQHSEVEMLALWIAVFPYAESLYMTWILLGVILPRLEQPDMECETVSDGLLCVETPGQENACRRTSIL
jgi:hypothetical protein